MQNVIQMALKIIATFPKITKISKKLPMASSGWVPRPQTPTCDAFELQ